MKLKWSTTFFSALVATLFAFIVYADLPATQTIHVYDIGNGQHRSWPIPFNTSPIDWTHQTTKTDGTSSAGFPTGSKIYQWDGDSFALYATITSPSTLTYDVEIGNTYAVATTFSGGQSALSEPVAMVGTWRDALIAAYPPAAANTVSAVTSSSAVATKIAALNKLTNPVLYVSDDDGNISWTTSNSLGWIHVPVTINGDASNYITIMAKPGDTPVIHGHYPTASNTSQRLVTVYGDYIRIYGLTVESSARFGFDIRGSYADIRENIAQDNYDSGFLLHYNDEDGDGYNRGNVLEYNISRFARVDPGISISFDGGATSAWLDDNVIQRNIVYRNGFDRSNVVTDPSGNADGINGFKLLHEEFLPGVINFSSGSEEPLVGHVIEQVGSSPVKQGEVAYVSLTSGSWAGGDAAGKIFVVHSVSSAFGTSAVIKNNTTATADIANTTSSSNSASGYYDPAEHSNRQSAARGTQIRYNIVFANHDDCIDVSAGLDTKFISNIGANCGSSGNRGIKIFADIFESNTVLGNLLFRQNPDGLTGSSFGFEQNVNFPAISTHIPHLGGPINYNTGNGAYHHDTGTLSTTNFKFESNATGLNLNNVSGLGGSDSGPNGTFTSTTNSFNSTPAINDDTYVLVSETLTGTLVEDMWRNKYYEVTNKFMPTLSGNVYNNGTNNTTYYQATADDNTTTPADPRDLTKIHWFSKGEASPVPDRGPVGYTKIRPPVLVLGD